MKRRGLSTIVGAVFFVIVMASTIYYVTFSMDLIDNLAESITIKQDQNLNRQNEDFKITKVSVDGNEFNLTVTNTGSIPINITRMWAQNITDSFWNQTKYQLNQLISPGQSVPNIGQGTGLIALDSQSYSLKLVTERGNSKNTQVLSTSGQQLEMSLFTSPANPLTQQNVTLLYAVKNNLTEGSIIQSLTPQMTGPTTTGGASVDLKEGPTPTTVEGLAPGEIALFEWTYEVAGNSGDTITFNATVANAAQGNFVTDTSIIDVAVSEGMGQIAMDFSSFESCDLPNKDCTSDSTKWENAWSVDKDSTYIFRLNVTNIGTDNIVVKNNTAIMLMLTETAGTPPTSAIETYFIKADSTTSNEDPGVYIDESKTLTAGGNSEILYFGLEAINVATIRNTHGSSATAAVFLVIFGEIDGDPYSQNLPFQALQIKG